LLNGDVNLLAERPTRFSPNDLLFVYKIHRPALAAGRQQRSWAALQADLLAPPTAHAKPQPFQAIKARLTHALHWPVLTAQHDYDPPLAKPWPRVGKVKNARP